jgi:hypothetical protein
MLVGFIFNDVFGGWVKISKVGIPHKLHEFIEFNVSSVLYIVSEIQIVVNPVSFGVIRIVTSCPQLREVLWKQV